MTPGPMHVRMHADDNHDASVQTLAADLVLDALRLLVGQVLLDVERVHDGDDGVQAQALRQELVHEEGLRDRGGVRQACRSVVTMTLKSQHPQGIPGKRALKIALMGSACMRMDTSPPGLSHFPAEVTTLGARAPWLVCVCAVAAGGLIDRLEQ